jgi:hypothetical protein
MSCRPATPLIAAAELPLCAHKQGPAAATLPPRCRRQPRVANAATTLPAIAMLLQPCCHCSASAAGVLPPLTQTVCRCDAAAGRGDLKLIALIAREGFTNFFSLE